jgi:CheY-like chemotaxis protein
MKHPSDADNRRILVIDDNPCIHSDFQKILNPPPTSTPELAQLEASLFGATTPAPVQAHERFELTSASQGDEALSLDGTDLSPQQRECVDIARSSANALLVIINDILDISKIEAGKLRIESVSFDLRSLIASVREMFAARLQEKGLRLDIHQAATVPHFVVGDPSRIRQVLINLVNNAIKFTPAGSVRIQVAPESKGQDPTRLTLSVQDTGIGIAPEQIDRIFEQFAQGDTTTRRQFGGTGLGLAISQELTRLMGGTMWVTSQPGQGSTFWFTLPLPAAPNTPPQHVADSHPAASVAPPPAPAESPQVTRKVRALLVDDSVTNRRVGQLMLERIGCEVDLASDGQEALRKLDQQAYDVVFMDCEMPRMNGFDATAEIRRRQNGAPRIPVVAMTAKAIQGDRERCLTAGMDDYLSKPVTLESLRAILTRWTP